MPWKGEGAAREAASSVYSAIKDLTCFQHLAPPMRPQELSFQLQQAYGSSGGAGVSVPEVRNADTNANTGVGFGAAPVRVSPFVSALCMRNAVQAAAGASTTTTSTVSAPSPPLQVSVHVTPAKALHPCYEDEEEESPLLSLFGDETDVPTPPVPKKTTLAPAAPAPLAPAPVAKRMKGGQSSKAAPAVLPTAKQRSATAVVPEEQRAAPVTTKKSIVRSSAPAQAHAAVVAAVAIAQQHQLRPGIGSNADDSDDLDLGSSSSGSSSSDFDSDVELDHKTAAPIQTTPLRTSMVAAKKVNFNPLCCAVVITCSNLHVFSVRTGLLIIFC